jgi:hypothetical protein
MLPDAIPHLIADLFWRIEMVEARAPASADYDTCHQLKKRKP